MGALLLVRYGELALKSPPVRREFESTLRRNLLDQFVRAGRPGRLRSDRGHLYLEADDGPEAARLARRVFGVTSVSEVFEVPSEPARIRDRLLELAEPRLGPGRSFAVRARRTGQHPFTSQQLAGDLGGDVLERFADRGLHVNLEDPDVELFVEVRGPRTYLYFDRVTGPGGLPLGVAGRLVAWVDGERGALGAYLMMKRGCRVALVAPAPAQDPFVDILSRYDPRLRRVSAPDPGAEWAAAVAELADVTSADGIVVPLRVEEYEGLRGRWGDRVIFSPTVGLTDAEVLERWRTIVERAS